MRRYPAGTRFLCPRSGHTYQLGAKHGLSQFWMLQENPPSKGLVPATTILKEFEVLRGGVE
jgi:hypothetical protein